MNEGTVVELAQQELRDIGAGEPAARPFFHPVVAGPRAICEEPGTDDSPVEAAFVDDLFLKSSSAYSSLRNDGTRIFMKTHPGASSTALLSPALRASWHAKRLTPCFSIAATMCRALMKEGPPVSPARDGSLDPRRVGP